jgi:DNA primase (bacterial type)
MYHVGMYGAVAPLGTSLSEDQLLLMWKYCDEPIVCMDGDNAGYKSAVRTLNIAIPILKPGKSLKFTFLPEGKDPDNLISDGKKDLLEQKIKNPISMFDFFWQSETKNILLDTPERRAGFKRDIEKKISSIIDKTVKQEYKNSYYDYFNKFILKRNLVKNNKNNYNSYNIDRIIVDRAKKNLNTNKREINLIESILNNPHILNELDEDFSVLPIVNKELDYIRSGIVNIYAKNGPLSEEDIEKFKKNVKYSDIYDKYFNNTKWINKNFIPPYVKKNNDDVLGN